MSSPTSASLIADLFAPHPVVARRATASIDHIAALAPSEAPRITPMSGGRRVEYATGRACARAVLRDLGLAAGGIGSDERGAPIWPDGLTGSITHTEGVCAAAAARTSAGVDAIGLDIERIDRVGERVRRRILTADELAAVAAMSASDAAMHTAIAFASKEAVYKAQYQLTSTYLGFGAVEIRVAGNDVAFVGKHDLVAPIVSRATGRFAIEDGRVVVGVALVGETG